jgi:hypothetical protein
MAPPPTDREDRARATVARGLEFLESVQRVDGALPSAKWRREGTQIVDVAAEEAVFPTMFMAVSLLRVTGAERIRSRAADFAARHMEPAGVWRYLTRADAFRDSLAADVDDTALASLLLRECGRDVPRNRWLLLSNRDRDGQFFTWITAQGRWHLHPGRWRILAHQWKHRRRMREYYTASAARVTDVDAGVSANVVLYLGGDGNQALAQRLLDIVRTRSERASDRWYSDPFTLWYLISRALRPFTPLAGPVLVERVAGEQPVTPVQFAHAISVLLDWDADPPETWVDAVLAAQRPGGEWPREPVYTAWDEEWGGEATSTTFCVEALARWSARRDRGRSGSGSGCQGGPDRPVSA